LKVREQNFQIKMGMDELIIMPRAMLWLYLHNTQTSITVWHEIFAGVIVNFLAMVKDWFFELGINFF